MSKKQMGKSSYDREDALKKEFNDFLKEWSKKKGTLTEKMTLDNLVLLKSALRNVHNRATLETAKLFVKRLVKLLQTKFEQSQDDILKDVLATPPNANGYDIEYKDKQIAFVAEIKCNLPINNGDTFGANQIKGIRKDLECLRSGKSKSRLGLKGETALDGYYRFLGVYNDKEGRARKAMESLCKTIKDKYGSVEFLKKEHTMKDLNKSKKTIWIVMLGND